MNEKRMLGEYATAFVQDGMTLGLGTGTTAEAFLVTLSEKIKKEGISVRGVPTSLRTEEVARRLDIPLCYTGDIDLAVDGADQVDRKRFLLKGGGGAMLREKVVDYAAEDFICLVEKKKLVDSFTMPIPCEVLSFALEWVVCSLENIGAPTLRESGGAPIVTDNQNLIIDLKTQDYDPRDIEKRLGEIPGILGNGIFSRRCRIIVVDENCAVSEL